ncbi:MAG: hypothetical protein ISS31_09100 [Kiritimatiellae bacterium]|nr:hypothetical protein [Kiritimatiellia bacterium]
MKIRRLRVLALPAALLLLVCAGCAAGTETFESASAGFWNGLWHGLICVITFVIGLFSDTVRMYEPNNVGALYDLGFLLGAIISLGSGAGHGCRKKAKVVVCKEKEWEEIGVKVEEKVRKGIRKWLEESEQGEGNWEEIGRKVEEKIKRELKDWADE